jgi:hypothetical protein
MFFLLFTSVISERCTTYYTVERQENIQSVLSKFNMNLREFSELNPLNMNLNPGQTILVYSGYPPCGYDKPKNNEPLSMELDSFVLQEEISLFLCILHAQDIKDVSMALNLKRNLQIDQIMDKSGGILNNFEFAKFMGYKEIKYIKPSSGRFDSVSGFYINGTKHYILVDPADDSILFNPSKQKRFNPKSTANPFSRFYFVYADSEDYE